MNLTLKLEVGGGTDVQHATAEAVRIATLLNVDVEFVFNNITATAYPNDNPKAIADNVLKAMDQRKTNAFATHIF